jgi:hypothetical protein
MADNATQELDAIKKALEALWPLDEEARQRAVSGLAGALGVRQSGGSPGAVPPGGFGGGQGGNGGGDLGTAKQFLAAKAPQTEMERVTVHAYYLTHAKGMPHFSTKDINDLNTEAAGPRLSNASYTTSNAVKKGGFLAGAPGGKRQITARGEALVDALPNREAVAAALASMPGKPRRSSSGRKRKSGEKRK